MEVIMASILSHFCVSSLPVEAQEDCEIAQIHLNEYVCIDGFCSWEHDPEELLIRREEQVHEDEAKFVHSFEASHAVAPILVNGAPVKEHLRIQRECMVGRHTLEEYIEIFDASSDDVPATFNGVCSQPRNGMRIQLSDSRTARIYGPRSDAKNSKPRGKKHARGISLKLSADC